MSKITIFCEDIGHEKVIYALLTKLLPITIKLQVLSARHGRGRALSEMETYLKQVKANLIDRPDAIVIAIDANCKEYQGKKREIDAKIPIGLNDLIPVIHAIPDPHVERWMLLDSKAFKTVFGIGCAAPDQKCEKDRYKRLLNNEIKKAGGVVTLGWIEYADDIIQNINIDSIVKNDESIKRFIDEVNDLKKNWSIE